MKTKSIFISNPATARMTSGFPLLTLIALAAGMCGSLSAAGTGLLIANTGTNTEGLSTFSLNWTASSNSTYLVQSATSLAPGSTWSTLDAVFTPGKAGSYQLQVTATDSTGLSSPPATFYRLILPQPQISSVEPAIVAPGVPVDLYVFGQSFPTNSTLQVNGVTQSGTVYSNSTTLVQPSFTPDLAGNYKVSLVVGGVAMASFTVVCADVLTNPELVLQSPPAIDPPASPVQKGVIPQAGARLLFPASTNGKLLSKKGYDYYKGQSDLTAAGASSNPYFHDNGMSGDMPGLAKKDFKGHVALLKAFDGGNDSSSARLRTKTGHVILMKAFDDGSDGVEGSLKAEHLWQPGTSDPGGPMFCGLSRSCSSGLSTCIAGVQLFSGEVQACAVDLVIPGRGLDFVWARTYHSRLGRFGSATNGWTFCYDVRCAQNSSGGLDVYDGTGRKDTFTLGTNGFYTCPQFFREGTVSNNTFTLTFADTGRWVFNPFDGTSAAGKLIQIITRNGDTMTLGYDTSGRLTQVVDDLGRTNTMSYNTGGQLASVTDFSGRSVTYQYYSGAKADNGSAGDLKSVTSPPVTGTPNGNDFPSGKTVTYTYSKSFPLDRENHLLLTVTDPKGQPAAVFSYEHNSASTNYLHCLMAQAGTNTASTYSWSLKQHPAGSQAPLNNPSESVPGFFKCIANDPVGNVTEDYFDARGRCVLEREFNGRATPGVPVTDTVNRPTGQLRSTDPAYYETQWAWNNDSLCTAEMAPGGEQRQFVYQSDFDPATTARKRADCRVVREIASSAVDLDGDGIPDVTARAWYYTYDPRFGSSGSPPSVSMSAKRACIFNLGLKGRMTPPPSGGGSPGNPPLEVADKGIMVAKPAGGTSGPTPSGYSKGIILCPPNGSARSKGAESTLKGKAIGTKGTGSVFRGWDGTIKGVAIADVDQDGGLDFCVSATDPRGNVTTAGYDGNGNILLRFRKRPELLFQGWQESFAYDTHGQLTATTNAPDANGHSRVDMFSWSQGRITNCVVDAGGLALTENYEHDARGNLTRVIDPRGNDSLFTYNALDQLAQADSALVTANGSLSTFRTASQFGYDANDNLVQTATELRDSTGTLKGSQTDNYQYDGENRLSQVALSIDDSHAQTNRYTYDGNDECVQVLGPDAVSGADPNQSAVFQYDERGLLFQSCAAPGTVLAVTNQYSYDADGRSSGHAQEKITIAYETWSYDGFGRLASATDAMGNVSTFNYDANDNPKVARQFGELNDVPGSAGNIRLAESRFEYDGLDRCFRTHDLFFNPATQQSIGGGDAVASCVLAPNGECVSVTDSLGRTTSFGYDTAGRSTSFLSSGAIAGIVVARDACGNVTSSTETDVSALGGPPQVFITSYAYDSLNRCVRVSDNVGNTDSFAYDSLDRVVRETNPNGNDTTYAYDLLDNCLASTDYAGSSLSSGTPPIIVRSRSATYDTSARCLTSTDPNGNTTSYAYDSLGDCTTVVNADGTPIQKKWLPANFRTIATDPNGTTVTNIYDLCDRLIHRDIAARNVLATTTFETFAYDGCDRLVLAGNDVSQLTFTYDSFGDCTGGSQDGLAQSATYDSEGNPLSLTYPGGRVVTYAYDVLDQVTNVSTTANGVSHSQLARFAYAGPGRLAGIACDNGLNTRVDWNGLVNPANKAGDYGWQEVSRVRDGTVASPSLVCDVAGTYSRAQSKLTRADAGRSSLTLTYDALEQLLESTNSVPASDTMYALDAAGNRSHVITNGVLMTPDYALSSTLPPGDFQMNRYTTTPFGSQSYDANGNLIVRATSASPTFYHYDYADRLVEVDAVGTLGTLGPVATFTYDALGDRISKTTYPASPAAPLTNRYVLAVGATIHNGLYLHLPGVARILEERVGPSVSRAYCDIATDGGGWTSLCAFTPSGAPQYYHADDLGNVLALTDAGGNVLERYHYDDYGQPQFLDASGSPLVGGDGQPVTSSPLGNPFLFQDLEWDGETGLLGDGGGNYFDPPTGRAVRGKVKNIKDMGGSAGRAFEGNNPLSCGGGGMSKSKHDAAMAAIQNTR